MSTLAGGHALATRLAAIGAELLAWRALWSQHAFRNPRLPWERDHPELARALRALDTDAAARLHLDDAAADALLARWLPVARWHALEEVPALPVATGPIAWPRDSARDVPGRKWLQVEAFVRALPDGDDTRLLDWCAGKAHLARALAARFAGAELLALERDAALVCEAVRLARRAGIALRPVRCDVTGADAADWLDMSTHACALHACGHLHLRLFELAAARRPAALSCAPCCYHLAGERGARALSAAGRAAWPGLAQEDLRTAVQETATADAYARRRRRHLQQWQLGFDALVRTVRAVDEYVPIPPVQTELLRGDFPEFCRSLAARKGLELPREVDFAAFEAHGRRRFAEVTSLDLVRQRFRRLLELWLVLDRAMYLQEAGYAVSLGTFCPRDVSPRNLLLLARRAA